MMMSPLDYRSIRKTVNELAGATSQTCMEIRKIAASFLLAMTAISMLSPFFTAMGNKNSRHREERSDLHLFLSLKNAGKLPRNTGCTQ